MKLFGKKEAQPQESLSSTEQQLLIAIDLVKAARNINEIANELDAESVLEQLLHQWGYSLETRELRNPDFTLDEAHAQIIRMLGDVRELLGSSVATPPLQATLSNFVFTAGVAYGAPLTLVEPALEVMIEKKTSQTFDVVTEVDSELVDRLKQYILELSETESKDFLQTLNRGLEDKQQDLTRAIQAALEVQQAKEKKAKEPHPAKTKSSPKFCGNCGTALSTGGKFCGSCGAKVSAE